MHKKSFLTLLINLIFIFLGLSSYAQTPSCSEYLNQTQEEYSVQVKVWDTVNQLFMKNTGITNPINMNELMEGEFSGYFRNRDLLELLGYRIVDYKVRPNFANFDEFHKNYKNLVLKRIKKWNSENPNNPIKPSEVILNFVFPFYNVQTKHWLALDYNQFIPQGYKLVIDGLPPAQILYPSLAKGRFPMVLNSLAYHDVLGHSLSWALNPNYAKAYRSIAKHVVEKGGWPYLKKINTRAQRMFYFNESFFLIDKAALFTELSKTKLNPEAIQFMISTNRNSSHSVRSFDDQSYLPYLNQMSIEELEEFSVKLIKIFPRIMIKFGGAINDGLHLKLKAINALYYIESNFEHSIQRRARQQDKPNELKNRISFTLALLSLKSTYEVEDWANDMITNDDNKTGLFKMYFDLLVLIGQETRPFDSTFAEH